MKKFECKNCGAELYWDSNANCLKCEYCEAEYQPSDFGATSADLEEEATQNNKEPETADEYARATDDSDSIELVVYKCEHCGAEIVTAKSTIATTCAYCGRAISMTNKMVENFKPDLVIPFSIDEEKAKEIYKKHIRKNLLKPKTFVSENVIKKLKGIYVPFWLHSFVIDAHTDAEIERSHSRRVGDDKIIHHEEYRLSFDSQGVFTQVPTDALKNLDNALMESIEPYDYNTLKEFNPAYMAGFYAEEYNENEEATVTRALERGYATMDTSIDSEAKKHGAKRITSSNRSMSDLISKYTMLPVWLLNVDYKGKDYLFAINGQTGKIVGKIPVSKRKAAMILLFPSLIVYAIVFILMLFVVYGGVVS